MKRFSLFPILAACGLLSASAAFAQKTQTPDIPKTISYQGLLSNSDGSSIPDGNHTVTVTLYADQYGNSPVWSDTYETTTFGGVFNLYLGSQRPLPGSAEMNRPLWIGTAINGEQEMRPLTPMSASPYALNLPDGAVSNAKLAEGAVTAEKVDMDYVSSISVNGQRITAKGGELNLRSSEDIAITYDEVSGDVLIEPTAHHSTNGDKEKTGSFAAGDDAWGEFGDLVDPNTHNPVAAGNTNWIGTGGAVNFTIKVDNNTATGGGGGATGGVGRIMQYLPNSSSANILGGHFSNTIGTGVGNIIAGGGQNTDPSVPGPGANTIGNTSDYNTISGGQTNSIGQNVDGATISGGHRNSITTDNATIGGGYLNSVSHTEATIAGGSNNTVSGYVGFLGGGISNDITGSYSVVSGGRDNDVDGQYSTISGGNENKILNLTSSHDAIGGGNLNVIGAQDNDSWYSVIAGGYLNSMQADNAVIAGGSVNTVANGANYSTVSGGFQGTNEGQYSTIGGGSTNRILDVGSEFGTIGGGVNNTIAASGTPADNATVSGGKDNTASAGSSTVGGGISNTANGIASTVAGGEFNVATGDVATIGGGGYNTADNAAQFSTIAGGISNTIMAARYAGTIGGGSGNIVDGLFATVSGGRDNQAGSPHSYVGAGRNNIAGTTADLASYATVGGGSGNQIYSDYAGIVSGLSNLIEDGNPHSFIGGGRENIIYASTDPDIISSVIAGGRYNKVQAEAGASSIGGGSGNQIIPDAGIPNPNYLHATIPGGDNLIAQSWAQTVVGGYNLPKGSVSSRVVFGGDRNDPVLIVGGGFDVGGGTMQRFNAFEVSYNGHSVVYHKNGTGAATAAIRGATYTDNVIYAWGQATPTAGNVTVDCDFGVASIMWMAPGHYRVTMNLIEPLDDGTFAPMNLTCGSVTATIVHGSRVCAFINTSPITNMPGGPSYFDVYVSDPTGCVGTDEYPFTFKVTGCPAESQ